MGRCLVPNPGFTLAEDAALKNRLSFLSVADDRSADRPVQVFFRFPDGETEKKYPFITIDLIDINHARSRQESEVTYYYSNDAEVVQNVSSTQIDMDYFPSEYSSTELDGIVGGEGYVSTDQYVPVDLVYQVTTHCRSQRHDRKLTADMLRYVSPFRRGFIEIPEDGTIRRCDVLDWRPADILDQETGYKKRIFRKVFTVQVNAEIPQKDLTNVGVVETVNGTLTDNYSESNVLSTSFSEEF